jgi:hypothetical protein
MHIFGCIEDNLDIIIDRKDNSKIMNNQYQWKRLHFVFSAATLNWYCFLGPPLEYVREIGRALRCIGDELDRNEQIQRFVDLRNS